jgi:uncharacterized protein YllA (UPF0747 family)
MNRFVLDWLAGDRRFLERGAGSGAKGPRAAADSELARALIESNRRWGSAVEDEVRRWAAGESVTFAAGQQVGFAGGPLYTLAKLATLIRMKREAGARATVFFWLATEDHDYDEAATLHLPPREAGGPLVTLQAPRTRDSREMVGGMPVPEALIAQLVEYCGIPRPSWLREGITFRDSFAELVAAAAGEKIVFVDALLPELRLAGAPLFAHILERHDEVQEAVALRSRQLRDAGYVPQIEPRENGQYTLFFNVNEKNEREILDPARRPADLASLSTSALTRPLLQDAVLAPDVFVGGPAEVAYYAQIAPLYPIAGVTMPRVALRGHALVAPKRVVRTFERYGIEPASVFTDPDALLAEREPEGIAEIERIADRARRNLAEEITRIGEIALPAEHALARAIHRSIGHIEYHFEKLTERAVRGLVRKDRDRFAAVRELVATLYPGGRVQDRVTGWFAYWHEFGDYLVSRLVDEIEPDSDGFRIISL